MSVSPEDLLEQAKDAYFNQENKKAIALIDDLLKKHKDYAPAYFLKANIISMDFENRNDLLALEYYTKAIEAAPTSKEYRLMRADAYIMTPQHLGINLPEHYHFYDKAMEDCDYITNEMESDNYPEDYIAAAYDRKGDIYIHKGEHEEAVNQYNTSRSMSESFITTSFNKIAVLKQGLNDHIGALAAYDELIEIYTTTDSIFISDTDRAVAFWNRGRLKIDYLNQKNEGLADLKKVLEYDDSDFYKEEYENAK